MYVVESFVDNIVDLAVVSIVENLVDINVDISIGSIVGNIVEINVDPAVITKCIESEYKFDTVLCNYLLLEL